MPLDRREDGVRVALGESRALPSRREVGWESFQVKIMCPQAEGQVGWELLRVEVVRPQTEGEVG